MAVGERAGGAELDRARLTRPETRASFEADGTLYVRAPRQVLASLIGNLLRNALSHAAEGRVRIRLVAEELLIEEFWGRHGPAGTGPGLRSLLPRRVRRGEQGSGVGLTIVRRLSDGFDWPVDIDSTPGSVRACGLPSPKAISARAERRPALLAGGWRHRDSIRRQHSCRP
ncbi:MAG: ATP-binding protein [Gammaproteobacteria bacterium]|nr:ATP-binding protein [Gammaproteobacteria bacterium]